KILAKRKIDVTIVTEFERAIAEKIVEKGGRISSSELRKILKEVKKEKGMKRGVTLTRLLRDDFIARVKVPGMHPFYALTQEGIKKAGIEIKSKIHDKLQTSS
ncbi:hypothetical protein KEJ19_06055, partial [Candidatus Bathyarchaeota archaeon]|nr:hypothetical protein [Candidatus Bathyarchaeota archaeon]